MTAQKDYKSTCDTALFAAVADGDSAALSALTKKHLPLVKFVVRRFLGRGKEYDDLFQTGCLGLIKAIRKFDTGKDVRFSTYAVPMIMGEIRRFLRDDNPVHISRSLHDVSVKISRFVQDWECRHDKTPSVQQICDGMGVDPDIALLAIGSSRPVRSLNEPVGEDGAGTLSDMLPVYSMNGVDDRILLQDLLAKLDSTEKEIIICRFFHRKTQKEVGERLNLTQVQISRAESRIIDKMRSIADGNTTKYAIRDRCR